MNEIKRVSLNDLRIPFVSTVGLSQDRSIWYYDDQVKRLKKISIEGHRTFESTNFITDENADWSTIFSRNNDLVMQGKSGTTYLLNLFGQLKTKASVDAQIISSTADGLIALNAEKKFLYLLDLKNLSVIDLICLPDKLKDIVSVQMVGNFLYQVEKNGSLKIWKRY